MPASTTDPSHDAASPPPLRLRAAELARQGRLAEADAAYQGWLADHADDHEAWHARGLLAFRRGQQTLAVHWIEQATRCAGASALYFRDLCEINRRLGRIDAAQQAGQQAVKLAPQDPEAHYNLGLALLSAHAVGAAARAYRRVLELDPEHACAWNNLGQCEAALGNPDAAAEAYRRAVAINPRNTQAQHNLWRLQGQALHDQAPLVQAERLLDTGIALYREGRLDEAESLYRQALALHPEYPAALNSLGFVLQDQDRLEQAMACFEQALQLAPQFAVARLNLGMAQLKSGDWRAGLENYEARWTGSAESGEGRNLRPACPLPQWNGQPPAPGQRLLVYCEQGFGDMFQMSRYLSECARRFARVTVLVPEALLRVLRWSFGETVGKMEFDSRLPVDFSGWDWYCPLMSLPRAFGTVPENIPASVPYLRVPPVLAEFWRRRLNAAAPGKLRIGITWAGRPEHQYDARRSLRLAQLAPLFDDPRTAWVSLQKWTRDGDRPSARSGAQWLDWTEELADFGDTAALLTQLDLVVSIDSAIVHLAGGLNVPTWMLNRFDSEWRWFRGREDSPWYPRLRIFNQQTFGDWEGVIERVRTALSAFVAERCPAAQLAQPPQAKHPAHRPVPLPAGAQADGAPAHTRRARPTVVALTGLPRSGMTLLSRALGQHPEVFYAGRPSPLCRAVREMRRVLDVAADEDGEPPWQSALRGCVDGWYAQTRHRLCIDHSAEWLDAIESLLAADPGARAVICLRELTQLAASLTARPEPGVPAQDGAEWLPGGVATALDARIAGLEALAEWPQAYRRRLYLMRFEDFAAQPGHCLRHLHSWLGLPPHEVQVQTPVPFDAPRSAGVAVGPRTASAEFERRVRAAHPRYYALYYPQPQPQ